MKQRQLGRDGPMVGAVGFGCMSFGGFYGPATEAESFRALARARERGMTHLDTANVYGNGVSEEIMGRFFKGDPGDFVIATKASISRDAEGRRSFNNDPGHLREELVKSLKRMGLERVDLFYIHRRDPSLEIEAVMDGMLALRDEGLIGGIGFSEIAPSSLRRAAAVGPVMAVQSEYSLWTRQPELGLIQACEEVGAAFVPFSPLCRGMTAEAAPDRSTFTKIDIRYSNPRFQAPNFAANLAHFDALRGLAGDLGVSTAALAIAWVLDQGDHLIPIPGTRYAEHLDQCADGAEIEMTAAIRDEIARIMPLGFAHGARYSDTQQIGVERYC